MVICFCTLFSIVLFLFLFSIRLILQAQNLALDSITFSFLLWNFSVVGIMSVSYCIKFIFILGDSPKIFWHAPQKVTQGYLIVISGLMVINHIKGRKNN